MPQRRIYGMAWPGSALYGMTIADRGIMVELARMSRWSRNRGLTYSFRTHLYR